MDVLRECARRVTGADGITVVLRDGDLCHYVEEDAIGPLWKGRRFPMESCISGWCMLNRQQVVVPDIYVDPRIPHEAYRPTFVRSLAMTPIRTEDPIGAIGAYWARHHEASLVELEVLQALGDSAALAIANARMIEALRESSRRKDDLLSMLAHELRNPLAPIRNALHVLRVQSREEDGVTQRAREMMERQIQLLSRIVDDLLDVARLNSGRVPLRSERLDLARVVRQSAEDCRDLLEKAGLTLELYLPETPVWISGDALRLSQVVGNLLDNARKFTPSGGRVAVRLTTEDGSGKAVLTLSDTGIGIAAEVLPHIFEVFTQARQPLDRSPGGLGLGLSVVRGLLELHGGSIQATSEGLGRGCVFTCELPGEAELPALAEGATPDNAPRQPLRVLVVEDNKDAAESLRMFLELFGHGVTLAHTGPEGVAAAKAMRPDVVLCDIGLPGMDGFTVADTLRRSPETAEARLIAVTGYGEEEDRRRALAAGFDIHLVKPVDPQKLLGYLI
jgi:signal transduction histidine kinase